MNIEFNPRNIACILAIGNPEKEYENTYHNVGYEAIEMLLGENTTWKKHQKGHFIYTREKLYGAVKSQTAMNNSGVAAQEALTYFKCHPEELLVFHDESDLPLGEYKLHYGRGSAGHKGIASIMTHLHTPLFWRFRIGIRDPLSHHNKKAGTFVLKKISTSHHSILQETYKNLALLLKLPTI